MTNVIPVSATADHRALVIGEVRAEMGRKRVSASELARRTSVTQQYWSRRLTGLTALDIDDLASLAAVLQVPMSRFVPEFTPEPDPNPATSDYGVVVSLAEYRAGRNVPESEEATIAAV